MIMRLHIAWKWIFHEKRNGQVNRNNIPIFLKKIKNLSMEGILYYRAIPNSPDIQQLHLFFPNVPLEQVATIYWDSGNNLQKAANRILGKEDGLLFFAFSPIAYIQDEPKVELEYLQLKYSFIPSSEITAVFLRCQNNYTRADRTIRDEYDSTIRLHWNELQVFENRNGRYTHRSVVAEHKRLNTHYTSHTLEVEEEPEEEEYRDISRIVDNEY